MYVGNVCAREGLLMCWSLIFIYYVSEVCGREASHTRVCVCVCVVCVRLCGVCVFACVYTLYPTFVFRVCVLWSLYICMYACVLHIHTFIHLHVCMCLHMYTYIHIHTCRSTRRPSNVLHSGNPSLSIIL